MRYFILLLMSVCLFGADEPKSPSTLIYEKALSDNAREASVAFESYWKALEATNAKVIKSLELAKVDLNDPKKGSLSISDRAKAIMELDEKIIAVKSGAINELLVANKKMIANDTGAVKYGIVGKWKFAYGKNNYFREFFSDGTGTISDPKSDGVVEAKKVKWTLKEKNIYYVTFVDTDRFNITIKIDSPGKQCSIVWNGNGSTETWTYVK